MRQAIERTAQLTMWNVLSLGPEFLVEGRRYMVRFTRHLHMTLALSGACR